MSFLSGFVEFFGVIVSCILVQLCNMYFSYKSPPAPIPLKYMTYACFCVFGVLLVAYLINFPNLLQHTHSEVAKFKLEAREECMKLMKEERYIEAEDAVRANPVGKEKALEFTKNSRLTVSRFVLAWANPLLFGFGALYSVLPFLVALVLTTFTPIKLFKPSTWSIIMPVINIVTIYTCIGFVAFYFFVDSLRVSSCTLVSGHWFMYVITTYACVIVLVHFFVNSSTGSLTLWYLGWIGMYQAIVLMVLSRTQMFYHDSHEALGGIEVGMVVGLFILVAALVVELRMRRIRKKEEIEERKNEKKILEERIKQETKGDKDAAQKILKEASTSLEGEKTTSNPPETKQQQKVTTTPKAPPAAPTAAPAAPPPAPPAAPPAAPRAPPSARPAKPATTSTTSTPRRGGAEPKLSLIDEIKNFNQKALRHKEEKEKKKANDTSTIAGLLSVRMASLRTSVGLGDDDLDDDVGLVEWKD